jgi:FtsH-binding integral membrane protein
VASSAALPLPTFRTAWTVSAGTNRASPALALIYAIAGLVIFAGLTLFDFQRLRQAKDIRAAPLLAASIFLDILNVFLLFLSILGRNN